MEGAASSANSASMYVASRIKLPWPPCSKRALLPCIIKGRKEFFQLHTHLLQWVLEKLVMGNSELDLIVWSRRNPAQTPTELLVGRAISGESETSTSKPMEDATVTGCCRTLYTITSSPPVA